MKELDLCQITLSQSNRRICFMYLRIVQYSYEPIRFVHMSNVVLFIFETLLLMLLLDGRISLLQTLVIQRKTQSGLHVKADFTLFEVFADCIVAECNELSFGMTCTRPIVLHESPLRAYNCHNIDILLLQNIRANRIKFKTNR